MIKREDIHIRDPFVYVENDKCYMVGTVGRTSWGGKCDGFDCYVSTDLENFEGPYHIYDKEEGFWGEYHFWAPELHHYNNQYLLVASFKSDDHERASQVLYSDKILGPYKATEKPFTPSDWSCLDATLFIEDGVLYTIFCHEWTQIHNGEMCLARMDNNYQIIDKPITLFKAHDAKWAIDKEGPGNYVTDGPFIYKLKSNRLIMIWSSHSITGYAVGMAYSDHGIKGPWHHFDEPLFKQNGGHGMIFKFNNKLYLSLHQPNTPPGKERPFFFEIKEDDEKLYIK